MALVSHIELNQRLSHTYPYQSNNTRGYAQVSSAQISFVEDC